MCIPSRIKKYIAEKEALDARIAKLEELEIKTAPAKNLLTELLAGYAEESPEDLASVWDEVLTIGQKYQLSVQPLAADELQQWEADRAELEKLKFAAEVWRQQLEESEADVAEQDSAWGELCDERDDLEKELAEVRSQLAQMQATYINPNPSPELTTEENTEVAARLADFAEEMQSQKYSQVEVEELQTIPAFTLWQPWATLITEGVKRIETRSWATNYRGPIAIHAAKKPVSLSDYPPLFDLLPDDCEIPLGAVVAIVNLIDCVEMTPEFIAQQSEQELKCGDWKPGRFAWVLELVRPVVPPVQVSGGQKLWSWSGTSVAAELEYLERLKAAPEQDAIFVGNEYDACFDDDDQTSTESILTSHGFFLPDINLGDCYDPEQKYEDYQDWAIYYSQTDQEGPVDGIGLYNESAGFWDASTEMIGEDDPTFPENFRDYDAIVAWTKQLIDQVVAATPLESSEVPGQLALEFPEPKPQPEPAKPETDTNFEAKGYTVQVYPQYADGKTLAGVTLRFLNSEHTFVFDRSLTADEIGDRTYKTIAWELIQNYREKEAERLERIANPHAKEEDKFVELVKLSNHIGYLKRRDTGEILAEYVAFSGKDENGEKLTFAKPRAEKWAEYFRANNAASEEGKILQLVINDPRKSKRLISDNPKQVFTYEIKITGADINYLERLAQIDLSLPPGEQKAKKTPTAKLPVEAASIYKVITNGFEVASGTEKTCRYHFETELKTLGGRGSKISVALMCGSEVVERYAVADFQFVEAQDFDEENPRYWVLHQPTRVSFHVYLPLLRDPESGWLNDVHPHNGLSTKEAAAVDAVRRSLKAEKAE